MRFLRIGPPGAETPVVATPDGECHDLRSVTADIDGAFLGSGAVERARTALAAGALPPFDVTGLRIGPPVARPGVVLCVGLNYAAHAAESGSPPPEHPVVFYKAPNTVVGPYDDLLLPRGSDRTDWEVELAVVIGRKARYLESPEQALACIGGYTVSNDVSERRLQLETSGGQWSKGKSCETFNPLGPWLLTPDEVPDPQALGLRSWVNGEPRQSSSTADMIFDVTKLIHLLSQVTVLEPGDIVNTGTPEGVALSGRFPYLTEGDLVEVEIDGLGRQTQKAVRA
ncbi:fumarylacetoacetate hydrolase family protein [Streptomyces sp. NBC_01320]|uniref:fumarylacetoacetate hydrolase family protein n=1 Tax=Streptomyces sp. NBC_01320 TaxID=2903824 RepID=UPI002E10BAA9|nr:fumarylacetoacetate hydrolase family protein [Streptomyces sp. NBC_01320]